MQRYSGLNSNLGSTAQRISIFGELLAKNGGTGTSDISGLDHGTYIIVSHTGNTPWRYIGFLFKTSVATTLVDIVTSIAYMTVTQAANVITVKNTNANYDTSIKLTAVKLNI